MLDKERPRNIARIFLLLLVVGQMAGCASLQRLGRASSETEQLLPPLAAKIPKADTLHGDVRVDNYFWLRETANPEVMKYLEAENSYTQALMLGTEQLQRELYGELLARIKETDTTAAEKCGDFYYYDRTAEGMEYPVHCRKKGSLDSSEEVILDENDLAAGHEYLELGTFEVSPDQSILAYSFDTTGSESYTLRFKRIDSGETLEEEIQNTGPGVAWASDNRTVFYTVLDSASRPFELFRHALGAAADLDSLVYHEKDEAFFVGVSRTRDGECILLEASSHTTSEFRYLRSDSAHGPFRTIQPREQGVEYYVDHGKGTFFIRTNYDAENFRLVKALEDSPSRENWVDVVPGRDSAKVEDFQVFKDHVAVFERAKGLQQIRTIDLRDGSARFVQFSEPTYSVSPGKNREYDSETVRFNYTSLVTPQSVYDYNMATGERELMKEYGIPGGFDSSLYSSERIFARAGDGTPVPISLVYRRGIRRDGKNPCILYGYGSYGSSFDPYFSSNRLSLLDRGFIYAIALVRGGGEMCRYWYKQGKLLSKMNTFTDFTSCAEYLIAQGYTSEEKLVISGASAGGLLIGAVTNMRPELFKAVVADVPFVDLLNTMLDPSLPLTVIEYEEWGNPNVEEYYSYMKSYSPYDNVRRQAYPGMLITAGLYDTRVSYWEAAKWTAKLRAMKTDSNALLFKTRMSAGHAGISGRYGYLRDVAFEYAYLLRLSGVTEE